MSVIDVRIQCPDVETADRIAAALIEARLAAAANRHPDIVSRYVWNGALVTAREVPLILRSQRAHFEAIAREVLRLHPYDTPSITGVALDDVSPRYAAWVADMTANPRASV
ncbi:MAG: divalent-cation tolerance protein CutA [Pseudomonadota bacterium]